MWGEKKPSEAENNLEENFDYESEENYTPEELTPNSSYYKLQIEEIGTFENKMIHDIDTEESEYASFLSVRITYDQQKKKEIIDLTIRDKVTDLKSIGVKIYDVESDGTYSIDKRGGSAGELNDIYLKNMVLICEKGVATISNLKKPNGYTFHADYDLKLEGEYINYEDDKVYKVKLEVTSETTN